MATYNVQIEDSAGNKYHPKPDLLTTKEQLAANTAAGKSADALVVKEIYSNLTTKLPGQLKLIAEGSGANVKYYAQLGADAASKKRLGSEESMFKDIAYIFKDGTFNTNVASYTLYSASITDKCIVGSGSGGVYGIIVNPGSYKYFTVKCKSITTGVNSGQFGIGKSSGKLPGLVSSGTGRSHYSSMWTTVDAWSYHTMIVSASAPLYYVTDCIIDSIFLHNGLIG